MNVHFFKYHSNTFSKWFKFLSEVKFKIVLFTMCMKKCQNKINYFQKKKKFKYLFQKSSDLADWVATAA